MRSGGGGGGGGTASRNGTTKSYGNTSDRDTGYDQTYTNQAYDSQHDTLKSNRSQPSATSNNSTLARGDNYASITRAPIGKKDCTLIFLD